MSTCRSKRSFSGSIAAASTAVVALAILGTPWWAACDSTPMEEQVAEPLTSPAVEQEETSATGEVLGRATMEDIEPILESLARSGALNSTSAEAPDCVDGFRRQTQECVQEMRDIAMPCVAQIEQFFEDGELEAAQDAADECRRKINQHTATCLAELKSACQHCIGGLMEQGAEPNVIGSVLRACRRAAEHLLEARRAATGAIDHAVDSGVAAACVASVQEAATACAEQNGQKSEQCVEEIEGLLAGGQTEAAVAAGQACIQNVVQHSAQCVGGIQEHCHDCLQSIVRNCGDGMLIGGVHQACQNNTGLVIGSAQAAVAAIQAALPDERP